MVDSSDTTPKWNSGVAEKDLTKIAFTSQHEKKIWQPSQTSIQRTPSDPAKAVTVDALTEIGVCSQMQQVQ